MSDVRPWSCELARRAIHRRLDGEGLEGLEERDLAEHLRSCPACGDAEADLRSIQRGLRALPLPALPDAALSAVLDSTIRARRRPVRWQFGHDARLAAAAAVVTVAVIGGWYAFYPQPRQPSEAQLVQAAAETRAVLRLTAAALRRAEHTATRGVLAGEVSPALRRVPIDWPSAQPSSGGGGPAL